MQRIFVTKTGLQALETRRLGLMDRLKAILQQKGPAVEEGTWHDNFSFEQLLRDESAVSKQLQDMRANLDAATIVPDVPSGTQTLQIGHVVQVYVEDDDISKVFVVGGFGETNFNTDAQLGTWIRS